MIKKYILVFALITQFTTEINTNSQTSFIMEKTLQTLTCIKNVSKKYAPKVMRFILYIGIPTVLTGSTLYCIISKDKKEQPTPFWQTCQDKTKLQLTAMQKSTNKFIQEHSPKISIAGTQVIKGLSHLAQGTALIIHDVLPQNSTQEQ